VGAPVAVSTNSRADRSSSSGGEVSGPLSGSTDLSGRKFPAQLTRPSGFFFLWPMMTVQLQSILEIEWLYSLAASPENDWPTHNRRARRRYVPSAPDLPKKSWTGTCHAVKTPGKAPVRKRFQRFPRKSRILDTIDQPGGPLRFRRCSNNHVTQSSSDSVLGSSGQRDGIRPHSSRRHQGGLEILK